MLTVDRQVLRAAFAAATFVALTAFVVHPFPSRAAEADDPKWRDYVVGSVHDLPDSPVKSFLLDAHLHNPYADEIAADSAYLGPFAPSANNIFWIPTIDMPVDEANWRFLSDIDKAPRAILQSAVYERGGKRYVRMFLHPFSTEEPAFRKFAAANGGFRFEFQGSTTASSRSLIAWKTKTPRPEKGPGSLQVPSSLRRTIAAKVSIHRVNIDGNRLNPLKKLVRAAMVTLLMGAIPDGVKSAKHFDFAGEWLAGVPGATDAGFAVREVLDQYLDPAGGSVEPAFTTVSLERLDELTANSRDIPGEVNEKIFRPLARAIAYLLMEEGMIGEYHTQNYAYYRDRAGNLTGTVALHDADAFRTSIVLRALAGKELAPLREVESPFYFMKDSVFSLTGSSLDGKLTLNALMADHVTNERWSTPGQVEVWCRKRLKAPWCRRASSMFNEILAEELSPYVGRAVTAKELNKWGSQTGSVGLIQVFKERLQVLSATSPAVVSAPDERLQLLLKDEFDRLLRIGSARKISGGSLELGATAYLLNIRGDTAFISAVSKNADPARRTLKGLALLGTAKDPAAVRFARDVARTAKVRIPLLEKSSPPILKDIGGGSNRKLMAAPLMCSTVFN